MPCSISPWQKSELAAIETLICTMREENRRVAVSLFQKRSRGGGEKLSFEKTLNDRKEKRTDEAEEIAT